MRVCPYVCLNYPMVYPSIVKLIMLGNCKDDLLAAITDSLFIGIEENTLLSILKCGSRGLSYHIDG